MFEPLQKSPLLQQLEHELAIGADDFICDFDPSGIPYWYYSGTLDEVVDWFKASFDMTEEHYDSNFLVPAGMRFTVVSRVDSLRKTRSTDRDSAWRYHLGACLLRREPSSELADRDESLTEVHELLAGYFAAASENRVSHETHIFQERWERAMGAQRTYASSVSAWVERMCRRG